MPDSTPVATQQILLEMEQGEGCVAGPPLAALPEGYKTAEAKRRYQLINRAQHTAVVVDVERLIDDDHRARAIWELLGTLDLTKFEKVIKSVEGQAGRPALEPRLLCSVWLYGYSEGITSARELQRMMEYEPALMWLTGLTSINHHTLSDFRVNRKEELDELFAQLLVVLESAGLVKLEQVMHDGTKVKSRAGVDSLRREETIQTKLNAARELVEQDPGASDKGNNKKREAARQRANRDRQARLQQALEEVQKLTEKQAEQEKEPRVSVSEPEARLMKHGDGGISPSYNVQVSTDAEAGVIVGVTVSQRASDDKEMTGAVDEIKANLNRDPVQVVVDGGFINRNSVEAMAERGVDLIGPMRDPRERSEAAMKSAGIDPAYAPHFFILDAASNSLTCPAGNRLSYEGSSKKRGNQYSQYRARGSDCVACAHQAKCCPKSAGKGRMVSKLESEPEVVAAFREKMKSEQAQQIYRRRGPVAEFPFANLKERYGVRKFRVFGRWKAEAEAMWGCLAHNVLIWKRRIWAKCVCEQSLVGA